MTRGLIPLLAAVLLGAACATAAQKRDKADAEALANQAFAAVEAARKAGGEAYAAAQLRSADEDARMAWAKLSAGDYSESMQRSHQAIESAEEVSSLSDAARKREAAKAAAALKPAAAKKKARLPSPKGAK